MPDGSQAVTSAVFVTFSAPDSGVFESQVLEYGRFMRSLGVDFRYLLIEGLRTGWADRGVIERRLSQLRDRFEVQIEQRYVPSPPSSLGRWLAAAMIRRLTPASRRVGLLIQARGALATCAALELRRQIGSVRVIYDARGDETAESRLEASLAPTPRERDWWMRRASRVERLEQRAGVGADHVLAVSAPLKEHICSLSGALPDRVTVVPCCVDPARVVRDPSIRQEVRLRLGLDDKFVVVYSGSLTAYQLPARVASLVAALRERVPRIHLLLLTRDRQGATREFSRLEEVGAATVVEPAYHAVGDYLAAGDAALLLRQDDAVNRVACPVKFAEYVVSGLPVVATPGIGDVSAYVRNTGHGVLVNLREPVTDQADCVAGAISSGRWPGRSDVRRQALEVFCRDCYKDAYAAILERFGAPSD